MTFCPSLRSIIILAAAAFRCLESVAYSQDVVEREQLMPPSRSLPTFDEIKRELPVAQFAPADYNDLNCEPKMGPAHGNKCHWLFGGEFVFVRPHTDDSQAFLLSESNGLSSTATGSDFSFDHELTARLWLAYSDCDGYGGRVRYWQFDEDANPIFLDLENGVTVSTGVNAPNIPTGDIGFSLLNAGDVALATYGLRLETVDVEFTKEIQYLSSRFLLAGGVRYLDMDQHAQFDVQNSGDTIRYLLHSNGMEGAGPTLSVEWWYPRCGGRLLFHSHIRGSAVFGKANQAAVDSQPTIVSSYQNHDAEAAMFVSEIGIGAQFTLGKYFLNGGWETQIWHGAGGPRDTTGDLVLEGFSAVVGLVY